MGSRGFVVFAQLSGSILLASWAVIGLAGWNVGPVEAVSAAAPAPSTESPGSAVMREMAAGAAGPAVTAPVLDAYLFSPHVTPVPQAQSMRLVGLRGTDSIEPADTLVTGSIRSARAAVEIKKTVEEWKSNKEGVLTVAQIARIKSILNLSPDQEQHWPPVEVALRDIAKQQAAQKAEGKSPKAPISADTAQRLYWTAGPLILSLREDQKDQARKLARMLGLNSVAALI